MKISADYLKFILPKLPKEPLKIRALLDDVGIEVKQVTNLGKDTIFSLELLANRGDHLSYQGIAKELRVRIGGDLIAPIIESIQVTASPVSVQIISEDCFHFATSLMDISSLHNELPDMMSHILSVSGYSVEDPIKKISMLVNLELGQPIFMYDGDKIKGDISIRESRLDEKALPIGFENAIVLEPGTLVVADSEKIIAIAGIISCQCALVDDQTQHILLESGMYNPVRIRITSRALRIQTPESIRFERGGDIDLPLTGLRRAIYLMKTVLNAKVINGLGDEHIVVKKRNNINLNINDLNRFLGTTLSSVVMSEKLRLLGFSCSHHQNQEDEWVISVPENRFWDIDCKEDIYEEVARSIGYNALPLRLPSNVIGVQPLASQVFKETFESVLVGFGFFEVITESFYGKKTRDLIKIKSDDPLWPHIEVLNSREKDVAFLRNNCLAHAMRTVAENIRHGEKNLKFFEWAKVFQPVKNKETLCKEVDVLWGVVLGHLISPKWRGESEIADIYFLKGVVQELSVACHIPLTLSLLSKKVCEYPITKMLHPYRSLYILHNKDVIGVVGQVHPGISESFGVRDIQPYYMEIQYQHLIHTNIKEKRTIREKMLPPVKRMVSFMIPKRFNAHDIVQGILDSGLSDLIKVDISDVYDLLDDAFSRSVTYDLYFKNRSGQPAGVINEQLDQLISGVIGKFKMFNVRLR